MTQNNTDIRWKQRFSNFRKAIVQLRDAVATGKSRSLSKLEEQGLIQNFEYTYELGWNVLKDYLEYQGEQDIKGSRDTIQKAFKSRLIEDGEGWMNMFRSRNLSTHTYNEDTAREIADLIINEYIILFEQLELTFQNII